MVMYGKSWLSSCCRMLRMSRVLTSAKVDSMTKLSLVFVTFCLSAFVLFSYEANRAQMEIEHNKPQSNRSASYALTLAVAEAALAGEGASTDHSTSSPTGENQPETVVPDTSLLLITNATVVQPDGRWMPERDKAFASCPNLEKWMKCEFNSSRAAFNQSHVVLFHARHLEDESFVPKYRPPGQKWVFYETEPPPKTWDRVKYDMDVWTQFNFTVSYTQDADVTWALYKLKCSLRDNWQPSKKNHAANKTKMAAWIVSNCVADSRRSVYADELAKHVQVDKYGACGQPTGCPPYPNGVDCINALLENHYKFYLGFENGFCSEYYTEKVGKTIPLNIIPVVMGYTNYSQLLPTGSYIDVRDFSSVKELADYMTYLSGNDTAYNEYIERKSRIKCRKWETVSFPCKLCEYAHTHRHRHQVVHDPRTFWGIKERCKSPKQFFGTIAKEILPKLTTPKGFAKMGIE